MGSKAIKIPVATWKLFLEISLGPGFISASSLNNSINNKVRMCP